MITVVINGQNYNYPEVGDTDWGSIATLAFDAITKTTLQPVKDLNDPTAVNDFTLYNDIDFGPTHGLRVVFIQSRSNNPAATGVFRLAKDELVAWRNEDNDGDNTISFDSDGDLIVNGVKVTLHGQIVNDDIAAGAGIEESKLALDYSTDSLHTLISDKALYNLVDTDLPDPTATPPDTPPNNQDVLLYDNDDSKWKNSNLLSSHVGNNSNPHLTNLVNLVDTTVVTPTKDDTLLYDDIDSKWKNKPNTVANLKDTTINTPLSGQVLTYDGNDSKWKNQPSASASLAGLTDTDISTTPPPDNGDVLSFDSNDSKWKNSNALTSHLGDKNNPHDTSVSKLTDTNIVTPIGNMDVLAYDDVAGEWTNTDYCSVHVNDYNNPHKTSVDNLTDSDIDSDTLTENDVMVFNDQTSKWENSQILVNHIGNAANPHLTTVAKLTDANITTPANKELLQYDYANSQWINSSDVWSTIEVNDIANINSASANVTLTASDKRHQIFTATQGFDVTLPSTGVSAGEKFVFSFEPSSGDYYSTTSFCFKASDDSIINYAHNSKFEYIFTAKINSPVASTDWFFSWRLVKRMTLEGHMDAIVASTAGTPTASKYTDRFTIFAGYWDVFFAGGVTPALNNNANIYSGIVLIYSDAGPVQSLTTSERIGVMQCVSIPRTSVDNSSFAINGTNYLSRTMLPTFMSGLAEVPYRSKAVTFFTRMVTISSSSSNQVTATAVANLVAPYIASI